MFSTYRYLYEASFAEDDVDYDVVIIESIFMLDMIRTFFTEYIPKDSSGTGKETKPVRNLGKIFWNYIYGEFALDFIPLVPL